jgi:hypothetical protein
MALRGTAFIAMWHDVQPQAEPEWSRWHTREHMPERVSIPGFRVGRRYVAWGLAKYRYFTMYEGDSLETFRSPAYLARLNAPTPWSNRMQPTFLNFVRIACETLISEGDGYGGALATWRLLLADGAETDFIAAMPELTRAVGAIEGVCGVHVGIARREVTQYRTRETELRGTDQMETFDATLLVEGIGRPELQAALAPITALAMAPRNRVRAELSAVYDLAYVLTEPQGK